MNVPKGRDVLLKQLVFVSLEPWDEVWRRNQFFCRELVGLGWSIVFVEPANDWSSGLRRLDRSQFRPRTVWSPEGLPQVRVVRPMKVLPKAWAFGERVNRRFWLAESGEGDTHAQSDIKTPPASRAIARPLPHA